MGRRAVIGIFAVIATISTVCGCGDDDSAGAPTADAGLRIASFDFAESALLAELYAQAVESTGVPVVRLGAIGPREIVAPALEQGGIDLVPEYLGTALAYAGAPTAEPDTSSALAGLNARLKPRGLRALDAAAAQDRNVVVVTRTTAATHDLRTISDLADITPPLRLGGPAECPDRPLCMAGLESVYGIEFVEFVPQRSLQFSAEALRRDEIDVAVMFSTDATLAAEDLIVLEDDLLLQPAENVVPVARVDALDRWGSGVIAALDEVSARLTTHALRSLNVEVGEGADLADVAGQWLRDRDIVAG